MTYCEDGNLVVERSSGGVIWSSKTEDHGAGKVTQRADGNLVITDRCDRTVFSAVGGYPE
jgi:hypothetical protein